MLVTSTISDGNMHPSFDTRTNEAQQNFSSFCDNQSIDLNELIGIRIDPAIIDADRISVSTDSEPFLENRGSVGVDKRLSTNALILVGEAIDTTGAFTIAADCFPVSVEGANSSTLLHVGRTAVKSAIIEKTLRIISDHDDINDLSVHVGPGVNTFCRVLQNIVQSCCDCGIGKGNIDIDGRNTFTNSSLYSRKASKIPFIKRPRGNQVSIMNGESVQNANIRDIQQTGNTELCVGET